MVFFLSKWEFHDPKLTPIPSRNFSNTSTQPPLSCFFDGMAIQNIITNKSTTKE